MEPTEECLANASSTSSQTGRAVPLSDSSELRILLIGEREAGKSAVGNAILGRGAFDPVGVRTRAAVMQRGALAQRRLTVVDTPGWEWFPSRGSSLAVRREIARGVSLCRPGPHAVLLVVPLSFTFAGRERRAAEEHMELLGERAWRHALVLFTVKGGRLRDATPEEEVEESEELRGLVDRCGGRFHALYGRPRRRGGCDAGAAELLAKLEDLVEANGGEALPGEEILEEAEEREAEEERRHREEEMEREEELKRMREALRELETEEEEEEEEEGGESSEESVRQQRVRSASSTVEESGSANASSPSPHLTWADLRSAFSKNCTTQ